MGAKINFLESTPVVGSASCLPWSETSRGFNIRDPRNLAMLRSSVFQEAAYSDRPGALVGPATVPSVGRRGARDINPDIQRAAKSAKLDTLPLVSDYLT